MKRWIVAIVFAAAAGLANAQPVEIEGVEFEPTARVGGQVLQLNGAGLRTRAFFKVYVAGLYVPQKTNSAATLLAQKGPRRVAITMLRDVDADAFSTAVSDGLEANHTPQQLAAFEAQIETLQANLKAIGNARRGSLIHFDFSPEGGMLIRVDGRQKGSAIMGNDFFTAVLRNWIGEYPVDAGLKRRLVGF